MQHLKKNFHKFVKKHRSSIPVALLAALVLILGAYYMSLNDKPLSLKEEALKVLEKCSKDSYRPACYDKEIPKLMDYLTMEQAFEVTIGVQQKDPQYLYCHVLGHNIADKETAKDPSKWKDVVTRCPVTMCNNGCPHGALMARFRENIDDFLTQEQLDSIKEDLKDVCEPRGSWKPREVERSMCYHALGHLAMYITNGDLSKSSQLCEEIGVSPDGKSHIQTCTEGAFMTIYQPLEAEDFALVENITPKKDDVTVFCSKYEDSPMAFNACRKEAWPLFRAEVFTSQGLTDFCSYTKDEYWRSSCFRSIMNPVTDTKIVELNDIEGFRDYCGGLPKEYQWYCVFGGAQRLIQIDPKLTEKALQFCEAMEPLGKEVQDKCYLALIQSGWMSFIPDSPQHKEYCSKLPEQFEFKCLNKGSQ